MRIPVALYPYSASLYGYVRLFDQLQTDYHLVELIAPSGFSLAGKDAACAVNYPELGMMVSSALDYSYDHWEIMILVVQDDDGDLLAEEYVSICVNSIKHKKKLIIYADLAEKIPQKIENLAVEFPEKISIFCLQKLIPEDVELKEYALSLQTPVLLVGGLIETPDIPLVILKLATRLKEMGIDSLLFCKNPLILMTGSTSLQDKFINGAIRESDKIDVIKYFIRRNELIKKPSLIIVEAPDALLSFSEIIPNGYGILTQMFALAAEPDMGILCLPYHFAEESFIERICNDLQNRLKLEIIAIHRSNVMLDLDEMMSKREVSFICCPEIDCHTSSCRDTQTDGRKIFSLIDGTMDAICERIAEYLNEDGSGDYEQQG